MSAPFQIKIVADIWKSYQEKNGWFEVMVPCSKHCMLLNSKFSLTKDFKISEITFLCEFNVNMFSDKKQNHIKHYIELIARLNLPINDLFHFLWCHVYNTDKKFVIRCAVLCCWFFVFVYEDTNHFWYINTSKCCDSI